MYAKAIYNIPNEHRYGCECECECEYEVCNKGGAAYKGTERWWKYRRTLRKLQDASVGCGEAAYILHTRMVSR